MTRCRTADRELSLTSKMFWWSPRSLFRSSERLWNMDFDQHIIINKPKTAVHRPQAVFCPFTCFSVWFCSQRDLPVIKCAFPLWCLFFTAGHRVVHIVRWGWRCSKAACQVFNSLSGPPTTFANSAFLCKYSRRHWGKTRWQRPKSSVGRDIQSCIFKVGEAFARSHTLFGSR